MSSPKIGTLSKDDFEFDTEFHSVSEKYFVFSVVWTIMSVVDKKGRVLLDHYLRDLESIFPSNNTFYDYYINPKKQDFELWENIVPNWILHQSSDFEQIFVPTIDTTRTMYIQIILFMITT